MRYKMKYTETQLGEFKTQLDTQLFNAISFRSEQIEDYINSYDYFLKTKPLPLGKHTSTYVAPVIETAHDRILPSVLDIFTSSENESVAYRPISSIYGKDGQMYNASLVADAVNKSISTTVIRENDGYEMLSEAFSESLLTGGAFLKWHIEEEYIEDCIEFDEWVPAEIVKQLHAEYPDTDFTKLEKRTKMLSTELPEEIRAQAELQGQTLPEEIDTPTIQIKGKLDLLRIERKRKVVHVPFGDMFVDPHAVDVESARYICHRKNSTVGGLLAMGYDVSKIESADDIDTTEPTDKKRILWSGQMSSREDETVTTTDPMERHVFVYEHYVYSSLLNKKNDHKSKLYRVLATYSEILEVEEVDEMPFAYAKGIAISGSFAGNSLYRKFKAYQDFRTEAVRTQADNARYTTYGRYTAIKGAYDRRSLLDNRPGGVIEETQPGSINLLPVHQTGQSFESVYAKVDEDYNSTLGSQVGDPFSAANASNIAATTVAMIMGNQDLKTKSIAGTIARTGVVPMYKGLYRLLRSEAIDLTLEDGTVFNTSNLPKLCNFVVDVTTANDDAMLTGAMTQMMMLDAQFGNAVTNLSAREYYLKTCKSSGMTPEEVESFVLKPQQPSPEDLQIMEAEKAMKIDAAAASLEAVKADVQLKAIEIAREEAMLEQDIQDRIAKRARDEEESLRKFQELQLKAEELGIELTKVDNELLIDREELKLETQQQRPVKLGD